MELSVIIGIVVAVLAIGAGAAIVWLRRNESAEGLIIDDLPADLKGRLPVSLHPVIDPTVCMGSGSCVAACPEGKILGLHEGRAFLVQPESCIGHGVCARECPVGAIKLVFGTAHRGVDIPHVSEDFETNIKGIYIAGELGGMGLIRNAASQGSQAALHVAKRAASRRGKAGPDGVLDLVVIGAGPAGLAAGLVAQQRGLDFAIIDQEDGIGGTIAHYPRNKIVLTGPFDIPGYGTVKKRELLKEELIDLWREVVESAELEIRFGQRLTGLRRGGDGVISVQTSGGELRAMSVILAIGRRGSPRKLGVPGEAASKVSYSLREPEAWAGARVLVVGGGDSALEAAMQLSAVANTQVTLSYRGETFFRAKLKNQERFAAAAARGDVRVEMSSNVVSIGDGAVRLRREDEAFEVPNDQLFIFAGGVLPTALLEDAGITLERKHGEA